jgi:hypothetical protein
MAEIGSGRWNKEWDAEREKYRDACTRAFAGRPLATEQITEGLFWEMRDALHKLEAWSRPFIEDTPISAETLWREFPQAIHEARALLAKLEAPQ